MTIPSTPATAARSSPGAALSHLVLRAHEATTDVTIDVFVRAMKQKEGERPGARMGDRDCLAFVFWHQDMGNGVATIESDDGTLEMAIEGGRKGKILWLPAHSITRLRPEKGNGWAIGVTANGTLRCVEGADSPVSREPDEAPDRAPEGTAEVLRWLGSGHVGASSLAMAHRMFGIPEEIQDPLAHPRDVESLRRCLEFLGAVPGASRKIAMMADVSPTWRALAAEWDGLEVLFKGEMAAGMSHRESGEALRAILERVESEPEESKTRDKINLGFRP